MAIDLMALEPQKISKDLKGKYILLYGEEKVGKAVSNNLIIPTTNGKKKVEEVKVGDYLFDRRGNPTKVLGVYPQGELDEYVITFKDGRKTSCSKDHIWTVKRNNEIINLTTEEMLEDYKDEQGRYKYSIPRTNAIQYPYEKYNIHPYIIGAFLGDGCCKERILTISSNDVEIVEKINTLLPESIGYEKNCRKNFNWHFKCSPFLNEKGNAEISNIQTLTLFKDFSGEICVGAEEKRIPTIYKKGSIEQRFNLLQGLFDTDGSVDKNSGKVTFTSISKNLINDVKEILLSLGFTTTIHTDERDKYKNGICYCLTVIGSAEEKIRLFSLERKINTLLDYINNRKYRKNYSYVSIINIEKTDKKIPMTCFYVDNEEHLFMINDNIVTHNTTIASKFPKVLIAAFEMG